MAASGRRSERHRRWRRPTVASRRATRRASVDPELTETLVVDPEVVGELVDDRQADLLGQVVRVRKVGLEGKPEEGDLVRHRGPVGAPLGARDALVEAVEGLVRGEPFGATLLKARFVVDDDGNLVEGGAKGLRDRGEGVGDEGLEGPVAAVTTGAPGPAAGFDHRARILASVPRDDGTGREEATADLGGVPAPDLTAEPAAFVVLVAPALRIAFLDWGGPSPDRRDAKAANGVGVVRGGQPTSEGVLLIHGLAGTAWHWAPVARRLRRRVRTVALDLRGHGGSDGPTGPYPPPDLAEDVVAVAEGAGLLDDPSDRVVLAGHGFGGIVAAWAAEALGARCAGLVLVDGGWEDVAAATGLEPAELLKAMEEPPEVLRSMAAFLADRAAFDPASWDADQERAARATVVELPVGRLELATRPHVLAACVEAMYAYRPIETLGGLESSIVALVAGDDPEGRRLAALDTVDEVRRAAGRSPIQRRRFEGLGHNLMRYRPAEVTAAILDLASALRSDLG